MPDNSNHNVIANAASSPMDAKTTMALPTASPEMSGLTSGDRLGGNFRLEKQIGRGGMGETWKAYDETADRFVVLKFVPKEILHVQEAIDLVRESFKKVHGLQHQHICPVYGLFNDSEHGLYLVMKFVDGVSLDTYRRRYAEKHGKISFSDIVQILWGIAQGLDYAHEKKVIHRDIKPQNIMIGKSDGVQIIDFGLAEDIRTSMARFSHDAVMSVAGTRAYMAPEQWRGRLQDARTDQYALAVTAYEMFAGHVPFAGSDIAVLRECVLNDAPEPIAVLPEYINTALLKALSKKRDDRYENCKAFIKAMITKPKQNISEENIQSDEMNPENPEQSALLNLPSDQPSGVTPSPVWVPPVMFTPLQTSNPAQKQTASVKKSMPFWFLPMMSAGTILILGLLSSFLFQEKPKQTAPLPTTSIAKKPIEENVTPSDKTNEKTPPKLPEAEPPQIESPKIELPKTEQNSAVKNDPAKQPPVESPNQKQLGPELVKVSTFENGLTPAGSDMYWNWKEENRGNRIATLTVDAGVLKIATEKKPDAAQTEVFYTPINFTKEKHYYLEIEMRS
ncbi:MAG: serine/threonine protein kinase, partial [Planctomycetaceae bacterium]|nr:serine/threonine protein kinase [Planctomycetaceae bacterium]